LISLKHKHQANPLSPIPDGFFDAGMLLQKLKVEEDKEKEKRQASRRNVGKALRIVEY